MNPVQQISETFIPNRLRVIPDPPKQLFCQGQLEPLLKRPCLAVVGSRKPTPYGKQVTNDLIGQLARLGIVIISGLAFGIDALAHQACLDGGGQTIAVLASSLDVIYPSSHRQLASKIVSTGGSLVAEYAVGTTTFKLNFVERNRLVSGLADAVLIIESAAKSGTFHTASFALDQGKTVMAIPGNITSPLSEGTNSLIKAGCMAVTTPQDILLAMGLDQQFNNNQQSLFGDNEDQSKILKLLSQGITDAGQLLIQSNLSPQTFNQSLTMLEITGRITPLGNNYWTLRGV